MERQKLEALRHTLSMRVSDLVRESMNAHEAGHRALSDELWKLMQQARDELRRIDAMLDRS